MEFTQQLAIESWVLYAIGIILIAARIASRCITAGAITKLRIEDYLMLFVAANFTADIWSLNEIAKNGSNYNYMTPETIMELTPELAKMAIYGSKMTLALEIFQLTATWGVKGCLLIMYHRLTQGLGKEHRAVKIVAVYCLLSYLLITILFLTLWCHPIYEYWRVPVKYSQCATYYHHMIFATAFNISSDLMLLAIPIPIIWRMQLVLKRKVILLFIMGLGIFNILTAVLNRYYNFSHPESVEYVNWYLGEVATAVYVGNIPLCWPVLRKLFSLNSWSHVSGNSGPESTHPTGPYTISHSAPRSTRRHNTVYDDTVLGLSESEERLAWAKNSRDDGIVELTPVWHHNAHYASVHAQDRDREEAEDGNIVKTVEVLQYRGKNGC